MKILLDMDGPLADFDQACWDWAINQGMTPDIPSLDEQTHRWMSRPTVS